MHQFLSAESLLTTVKNYFNCSVLKLLDLHNKFAYVKESPAFHNIWIEQMLKIFKLNTNLSSQIMCLSYIYLVFNKRNEENHLSHSRQKKLIICGLWTMDFTPYQINHNYNRNVCAQIYFPITSHNLKGKILRKEMALERVICVITIQIFGTTELQKLNSSPMLLPTHSIWLMPKIPSRWENSVIFYFKSELKNSQSSFLFAIKGENKTGLAMVLVVNQWPVTVKAWVKSHSSPCGICDKVTWRQGFLQVLQFATINVILPVFHTHISFICLCTTRNWKHR